MDRTDAVVDRAFALFEGLRITEIMYHPAGDEDLEFIELQNVSDVPLDLADVRLEGGIQFTFGPGVLEPGMHLVLARDVAAFRARYGPTAIVVGQYDGNLSNRSDDLTTTTANSSGCRHSARRLR